MRFGVLLFISVLAACSGAPAPPPAAVPPVARDLTGTFDYTGFAPPLPFALFGTITFEQTGDVVRVVNVTYGNANDRPLIGEATLVGDRLDIVLVPENGDMDFRADVTFVFSADGDSFEVAFSDTNGDTGQLGDYVGTRRP